jgi:hypothetical protein
MVAADCPVNAEPPLCAEPLPRPDGTVERIGTTIIDGSAWSAIRASSGTLR